MGSNTTMVEGYKNVIMVCASTWLLHSRPAAQDRGERYAGEEAMSEHHLLKPLGLTNLGPRWSTEFPGRIQIILGVSLRKRRRR